MAKIRHNNFLDTVDEVITDAKRGGVLHLYAEDEELTGRKIRIGGRDLFHFGTTGYLGLEQDVRLKQAAIQAILKCGTQFPLSKTYISHPLYKELEEKMHAMYGYPVIITKNSTLGHMAVIPCAVRDEDGVILDHQVHWSVQSASQILKTRDVPVEIIRHNNLNMLEDKVKDLSRTCKKIWYMADGVYSMYGDCAPIPELIALCHRYPQLHLYFDDVHGMSWVGQHGTGYVMSKLRELPENILLFGTLSKTFGASGAFLACSDTNLYRKIKNFGGPLTFSAQLEPACVAAASASASIHLSPEIYTLQAELSERVHYFNDLLSETELPLMARNDCPVFYIGTGTPASGYNFVNRLLKEGFFVNLGLFPAVPVKNTGVRITISRHNQKAEIKELTDAMEYHYTMALEETQTTTDRVRKAFGLPLIKERVHSGDVKEDALILQVENTIRNISKNEWNSVLGRQSVFDWDGLLFLEESFSGNNLIEHNWSFYYVVIRDRSGQIVLATFFTKALWKDDMLAPAAISQSLEIRRKLEPYYLTSYVLSMGSLFTEGQHLYLDKTHARWQDSLRLMLRKLEDLDEAVSLLVLRDFEVDDELNQFFHKEGFIRVDMPESCVVENVSFCNLNEYISFLSARSRKHLMKDILAYENHFDVTCRETALDEELKHWFNLYENVRNKNFDLNTFSLPEKAFMNMGNHHRWEFIVLDLKRHYDNRPEPLPVGIMFCYKNMDNTYVPSFIGIDYAYNNEHQIYRQLLFQTVKRAYSLGYRKVDFGMTASFEKRKVGATVIPKVAYVQAKDNFTMELIGAMRGTRGE
jgi:7-keto-8-aminopelargonate synthetase-like enzyme/predicted N-acyltransferase